MSVVATALSASPIPNPIVNQILGALNTVVGTLNTIQQNVVFDSLGKQRIVPIKSGIDGASLSLSLANSYIEDFVDSVNEIR